MITKRSSKIPIKRLYFDIETSPNIVYSWNIGYDLNLGYENIIKERAIICICYKWEDDPKVYHLSWDSKKNDYKMVHQFYDIITTADEIVGHNSDKYDIKWFKTRCLYHGILNIPEFKSIDTLKVSRSQFRFNSNRLDYIGQYLGLGKKLETGGFDLWKSVEDGDKEALEKMIAYCKQDVLLLEKIYKRLEGYSKPKTHIGLVKDHGKCSCPYCGNKKYKISKNRISASGLMKKQLQCQSCGRYYSVSQTVYEKDQL
jgi:DNA polymerase elongation subunit (family B)